MAEIEIFTTPFCGFCVQAKKLLQKKGVEFIEINLMRHPGRRAEMMERSNGSTSVPQIFIDGKNIGGCDELFELDIDDELDPLLGLNP